MDGCLLDTAVKDGRGLLEWLAPEALRAFVAGAQLAVVRATGADIAGVRSAACRDGRRTAAVDPERIARLRELCAAEAPRAA